MITYLFPKSNEAWNLLENMFIVAQEIFEVIAFWKEKNSSSLYSGVSLISMGDHRL